VPLIIWQLGEDLHALAQVLDAVASGTSRGEAIRNARVWGKRQSALEQAARRIPRSMIPDLLTSLARLDALAKGIGRGDVWEELLALGLALCRTPGDALGSRLKAARSGPADRPRSRG
jgi:DNA polymerase-3 subunit delta